jgi:Fe-S-cluster containining protein
MAPPDMIASMAASCLSIHARYQCRHAGACCQNWTVPAEPRVVQLVAERRLRPAGSNGPLFISSRNLDKHNGTMNVARDDNGRCVFFEQDGSRLCVIHREAGVEALPSACRHFPRKFLRDSRGTFVSLSHFCPTAALLLIGAATLDVVEAAPPLLLPDPIEGLDARGALPPLLCPGVLCDLDGYDAWERAAVDVLARRDLTWEQAVDRITTATERIRAWRPGTGSLASDVAAAYADSGDEATAHPLTQEQLVNLVWRLTAGRVPSDIAPIAAFEERWHAHVGSSFDRYDIPMKNYLAARLFANWVAYQGRGLRSIVQWVRAAAALVRHHALRRALESGLPPAPDDFIEAVRMADLLMLHVIDTHEFARAVIPVEGTLDGAGSRPFDVAQDGPVDVAQDGPFDSAQDEPA